MLQTPTAFYFAVALRNAPTSGGYIPRHASFSKHSKKVSDISLLRQNPGLGPILLPPKQNAFSFGQASHSVATVGAIKRKVPVGHAKHAPVALRPSPTIQLRTKISNFN